MGDTVINDPAKKFEGYSDLTGQANRSKKTAERKNASQAHIEYQNETIDNLQAQIGKMEMIIKELKTKEIDQKNMSSGYETLLRDGIPLNEHFLALKNKYNKEYKALEKEINDMKDENKLKQDENKNRENKLMIMKKEYTRYKQLFR